MKNYKALYEALLLEIEDKRMIDNALALVNAAIDLSIYSPMSISATLNSLLRVTKLLKAKDEFVSFTYKRLLWSLDTFGNDLAIEKICNHINQEVEEVRKNPFDLMEWVDIIFLALDGAGRLGNSGENILEAMQEKLEMNKARTWEAGKGDIPHRHIKEGAADLEKENKVLKEFVLDLLKDYPENFSYGPFEVEQAAIKHGIIVPTMVYEPCGENCNCREYVTTRELADGIECNRIAEFLGSKIDECPQCDPKVEGVCPDTTCEKFEGET